LPTFLHPIAPKSSQFYYRKIHGCQYTKYVMVMNGLDHSKFKFQVFCPTTSACLRYCWFADSNSIFI
jgi:hypothetical protein